MARYIPNEVCWELKWTIPPSPPVHPLSLTGRHSFDTMDAALTYFCKHLDDCILDSLTMVITERKDFTEDAIKRATIRREAKT